MSLASLRISNVRSIRSAMLEFGPRLNLIHGANGSGKTSILEAAFLLGRGRSFRTRHTDQLISRGGQSLQVFGHTAGPAHRIGFEYGRDESYTARLDGEDVRTLAELPSALFVEVVDPEVHRLVEGAPGERRRWLDWGVFHVEQSFLEQWVRFSRALRQRNAALKQGAEAGIWDRELAVHGEEVARQRSLWFETVKPYLNETIHSLSGLDIELTYFRGWAAEKTLAESLRDGEERDRVRGSTLAGPQRADIHLRAGGRPARESLSRGQQKLVAAAMVLALLQRLRERQATPPTLLLDDPAAELDQQRLEMLVDMVRQLECQLIITSLNPDMGLFGHPEQVFHVEQGQVSEFR